MSNVVLRYLRKVPMLLGVSVVYAHRAGAVRFSESRWFKVLPMVVVQLHT